MELGIDAGRDEKRPPGIALAQVVPECQGVVRLIQDIL
jgi:hypothetical protein